MNLINLSPKDMLDWLQKYFSISVAYAMGMEVNVGQKTRCRPVQYSSTLVVVFFVFECVLRMCKVFSSMCVFVCVYMRVFVWVCMCECYSVVIQSPMHVCIDQQAWSHRQQSLNLITDVFLCKTFFTAQNEQNEFTAIGTEMWNSDCEFHIGTEDWLLIKWSMTCMMFLLDLQTLQ